MEYNFPALARKMPHEFGSEKFFIFDENTVDRANLNAGFVHHIDTSVGDYISHSVEWADCCEQIVEGVAYQKLFVPYYKYVCRGEVTLQLGSHSFGKMRG